MRKLKKIEFVHQKHDGSWSGQVDREIFGGAHVSTLLPYDPERKEIVLIQQFRAGVISRYDEDYLYEIVAGIIDKDELPEDTAKRECLEETGCVVNKITPIISESIPTEKQVTTRRNNFLFHSIFIISKAKLNNRLNGVALINHDALL